MKNKFLLILFFLCFSCKKYDVEIPEIYKKPLKYYSINDTIYYESKSGDLDTMKIVGIDSSEVTRIYLGTVPPMKTISLRVQYLPIDHWQEEKIAGDDVLSQPLIEIIRFNSGQNQLSVIINLKCRDFEGEVSNMDKKVDTIFSEFSRFKPSQEKVDVVYWSNNKGIVGYKKRNGSEYYIKK